MKSHKVVFFFTALVLLFSCVAANALDVTPFFKIAQDYDASPIKAKKTWMGRNVCIEGEIYYINVMDDGDARVGFVGRSGSIEEEAVIYIFDFRGVPDELVELEKGQQVKIRGEIRQIKEDNNRIVISLYPSYLVQ